ncbi:right-handed parallel beta-helix repeat-containing protein [Halomarina ordinaria]|uniref:Right-handed parallel beta-helix repeat-containing protein n=1 Tax=Halomarina ordinaria TaxID=3033939 RepID=A0ABD5U5T9_9EURY|nr:right-handed parallel beta-helix repeat-containing protein [Halomarina sp. PSRA2]
MTSSRRSFLLATATVAGTAALAGCGALDGERDSGPEETTPDVRLAALDDGRVRVERGDETSVVDEPHAAVLRDALEASASGSGRPTVALRGRFTLEETVGLPAGLTFDLTGATLAVEGSYDLLSVREVSDVTVLGGTLDGGDQREGERFRAVLAVNRAERLTVAGTTVRNGGYYGLNLYESNDCLLYDVDASDNVRHGIHPGTDTADWGTGNRLVACVCTGNGVDGINDRGTTVPDGVVRNEYLRCTCRDNGENGLTLDGGEASAATVEHVVADQTATDNGRAGIFLKDARAVVVDPTLSDNGGEALQVAAGGDLDLERTAD